MPLPDDPRAVIQDLGDGVILIGPTPTPDQVKALFDEFRAGDAEEQRETFEALKKGLDEHRPEGYKLFP